MSHIMPRSLVLGVSVLITLSTQGIGEDAASKGEAAPNYRELVEQLASANKEPTTRNEVDHISVKFPDRYGPKAQGRIDLVRQKLHDDCEQALPFLVDALDDKRYSMTIYFEGFYNYSVGNVCHEVLASQIEVYRTKIHFRGPFHWHYYNYVPKAKEWFETRQGRTLAELQIEAIDWAIERCKTEPKRLFDGSRKDEVPDMQQLRDEIAKSGKPVSGVRMRRMVTADEQHGRDK